MLFIVVASLLSCLHQLKQENVRLEEHVRNLNKRRDHLLAVNARLQVHLSFPSTSNGPSNLRGGSSSPLVTQPTNAGEYFA